MFYSQSLTIPEIFDKVIQEKNAATKIEILKKHQGNEALRWVIKVMFGDLEFQIKEVPNYKPSVNNLGCCFTSINNKLRVLSNLTSFDTTVGKERAEIMLTIILESIHKDEAELLSKLIQGKRYKGISRSLVSLVFKDILA